MQDLTLVLFGIGRQTVDGADSGALKIESMHWILDVAFSEDDYRFLGENAHKSMDTLRKFVLAVQKISWPLITKILYERRYALLISYKH